MTLCLYLFLITNYREREREREQSGEEGKEDGKRDIDEETKREVKQNVDRENGNDGKEERERERVYILQLYVICRERGWLYTYNSIIVKEIWKHFVYIDRELVENRKINTICSREREGKLCVLFARDLQILSLLCRLFI